MTSEVEGYADWSINDLFCELISYVQSNIEDDATEAMKAAIVAAAHAEGVEEGAAAEKGKWKYKLDHCANRFDMGEEISCEDVLYQKNQNGVYAEAAEDLFILPVSALVSTFAPLLTEDDLNPPVLGTTTLLEDCGTSGILTRGGLFPPVLAPTKESEK